jgi:Na+-transporting methylmalonyl-CoA/oxaloacetate decarboxylase gamma subunit
MSGADLTTGLWLTVYGMGIVFALLGALALVLTVLLRFDRPPRAATASSPPAAPAGAPSEARPDEPSPEVLAAIMIAVRAHIRAVRKQAAPAMRRYQPGTLPSRWVASGRTRQNRSWSPGGRYV